MNLYVRISTKEITSRFGGPAPFAAFKRYEGDNEVRVVFLDDSHNPVALTVPAGKALAMTFGLKLAGDYAEDSESVVSSSNVVIEGTGPTTAYVFRPSFNTSQITAAFAAVTPSPVSLRCMGEVSWRFDTISPAAEGLPIKSQTFEASIAQAVLRGDEGTPEEDASPYSTLYAATEDARDAALAAQASAEAAQASAEDMRDEAVAAVGNIAVLVSQNSTGATFALGDNITVADGSGTYPTSIITFPN